MISVNGVGDSGGIGRETLCEATSRQLAETARPVHTVQLIFTRGLYDVPRHLHGGTLD